MQLLQLKTANALAAAVLSVIINWQRLTISKGFSHILVIKKIFYLFYYLILFNLKRIAKSPYHFTAWCITRLDGTNHAMRDITCHP